MDNQHPSLDACWLAGFINGDGMVTVINRPGPRETYTPRISITNTEHALIEEAAKILTSLKIRFHIQHHKPRGTWKAKHEIMINGLERCVEALPVLIPLLRGVKQERAKILFQLCLRRLGSTKNAPWTTQDIADATAIRSGHTSGPASKRVRDYTRNSRSSKHPLSGSVGDDIVQTATA